MKERLLSVFVKTLELNPATDPASIQRDAVESWDSLIQITLITAIENEFAITFDADEYAKITTFAAAETLLQQKGIH